MVGIPDGQRFRIDNDRSVQVPRNHGANAMMRRLNSNQAVCEPLLWPGDIDFRLFTEGDDLYAAMLAAIVGARQEIFLESYIFAPDEVGWRFAERLVERARTGVLVRVHLDAAGSFFRGSEQLGAFLRDGGVELRWFHHWQWSRPLRYNQRNHRKLLVVDAEQTFLGGFNIHRESSRIHFGKQRWRDTHVAVTGPLAEQARTAFRALWRDHDWSPDVTQGPSSAVIIPNRSSRCRHQLRCIFSMMFASARERIDVTTPYFVPDEWTQRALVRAASRGVAVRLLVPYRSDIAPIRWIARRIFTRIQCQGVRVFGYQPRLLHAKTITVDGDWTSIGTANLDYRSLFVNHELNLCARNSALATSLEAQFEADLVSSEEFAVADWPRGSVGSRLMAPAAWAARRWL